MWSKWKFANEILPIILKDRIIWQWYVESFVWWANVIDKVTWNRIGNDSNKYLISLLKWMLKNKKTPYVNHDKYIKIKDNKSEYSNWLVWFTWFQLSYWAKFFW